MAVVTNFNPPASWFEWKYALRFQPRKYYQATLIFMQGEWEDWMTFLRGAWKPYRRRPREKWDRTKAMWDDHTYIWP